MPRILFFVFLAFVFWLVIRLLGGARKRNEGRTDTPAPGPFASPKSIETISQCAWCGVHVPVDLAASLPDGRVYCSEAHRDAARQVATPVDRTAP